MLCPKCKNQISDKVLRCPHCNLKVKIICPKCKNISPMGKKFCAECGHSFFVVCSECGTINLSEAEICRKCRAIIKPKKQEAEAQEEIIKTGAAEENQTKTIDIEEVLEKIIEPDDKESTDEALVDNQSESSINNEEDGFMVSIDGSDVSEDQLKTILNKVEEIDKNEVKKAEAEALIQKKFEQKEEIEQESEEEIPPEYVQLNQQEAQATIVEAIHNPIKRIISLSGKEGFGKTLILKYVYTALRKDENYICAMGECNALTQITPFGYIQDVLLNICNLSNFSINIEEFIKNNLKAMEAKFFNLKQQEIFDLFNFLYPYKTSEFNGILKRKEYTIKILKKVIETLTIKSTLIFIVDDCENIDGASFNFLKNILSDEKFNEKIKVLITNKYNKIGQGYFYDITNNNLKENNYSNIFLSPLDKEQSTSLINTLFGINIDFPEEITTQIYENSKGASAYIEQACQYLGEIGAIKVNENQQYEFNNEFSNYILPHNTYRILEERTNALNSTYPIIVQCLYYASLLGNKFSILQFRNVLRYINVSDEDFNNICEYLIRQNYLSQISENYLTFQNTSIWHYIYEKAKTEENYIEINKNIYENISKLTLSNNSLKPLLLQNAENKRESFSYWKHNAEIASYLGDTNLYVISLKQQLKLANDIPDIITAAEKIHIYEQMGKILYKISSKEAINYLSTAIAYYKEETNYNPARVIELSGFLVQACKKTGNYTGVIEACDVALSAIPENEYTIEKALIASKKLNALLYLGNSEEIINLSNIELISTMEDALAKTNLSKMISDERIFDIWFNTNIDLATAYAIQGDKKVFEILSKVDDALYKNHIENSNQKRKILITKALAYSIRGEIKLSSDTLTVIKSDYSTEEMEEDYILRWNLINIINKIISKDYKNLIDEMFQVTTFADNINDLFSKNLLKLMLGYIIQTKSKNTNKALEIYNEEIVFFSKEKIATGALLCWLLIANISLITQGVDFALDIAKKALDVARNPKINNYIFIIALKQLIAEMYIIKGDYEAVKMYLDKAMLISQTHNIRFMQMVISHSFARYNAELINIYKEDSEKYANSAVEMYKKAIKLSQNLMLNTYENMYKKELTSFNVTCQLQNIILNLELDN